ncbi:MAG: Gfo/Idh/MocA family oxidoreductase [Acidimicrobiia bacterium]|nr:Gfo/Idh/MocA family oxidoreductase [Acidimicrobiia bacterium]
MASDKKVRLGVIGAGSWAVSNHIPVLHERDDVELVVAVRKGEEALAVIQEKFGFSHITEDYREALGHDLDAVVVASPSSLHHEHAKAAMEAGANVLCEKPFTINPADAWDLHQTAEQLGRHLVLSFGWNYRPIGVEAKRLMTEGGGVGDIEHVMVAMASGTRELLKATGSYEGAATDFMPEWDTWTDPKISGGGYGPAQLSHAMGLVLSLTGDRASQVFALMNNVGARVDLHDAISIRYESGATGTLSGASCPSAANAIDVADEPWPRHQLQARIYGSEGQLIVDLERDFLWHYREDGVDTKVELPEHAGLYLCDGPPNALIDLTLGRDVPNRSPADLGAKTVEVIHTAFESVRAGALVDVPGVG